MTYPSTENLYGCLQRIGSDDPMYGNISPDVLSRLIDFKIAEFGPDRTPRLTLGATGSASVSSLVIRKFVTFRRCASVVLPNLDPRPYRPPPNLSRRLPLSLSITRFVH